MAVIICILLVNPFNEAGFVDDWSYGHVAMKLAQTGTMQYNGWGSPILLFQSFWAVPWIRAFGFSFPVLQVSMIPISLGFVLLVYATGRRAGLSNELAAFASITTGTSPLFVPSAASFMTESCGCFFCMLGIYAALRAVQAEESGAAARWLWALALAGVVGGANRQIVWSAPVMLIPYLAWTRRADSRFRLHSAAAYGVSGLAILVIIHFFGQPYGPLQLGREQTIWLVLHHSGEVANLMTRLLLLCALTAMPAYCCFLAVAHRRPLAWLFISLVALTAGTVGLMLFAALGAPFGNNILTAVGIASEGQEWVRAKPEILPFWIRFVLTALVIACVSGSISWIARGRWKAQRQEQLATLSVFGVFSIGYLALIVPGALIGLAFDRYILPLAPLLILALLMQFARYQRRVPVAAWCCLLVFSCYGVATAHDYFAGLRTRIALAHTLERSGISRDRISAGFEYDGWTLVMRTGYVPVVQYADRFLDNSPRGFWFEFWNHGSDYRPERVILNWNAAGPAPAGEMSADFRAWTPPFQRSVVAWRRDDLTMRFRAATIAARMR